MQVVFVAKSKVTVVESGIPASPLSQYMGLRVHHLETTSLIVAKNFTSIDSSAPKMVH
jgi:hypothetical protein